MYAYACLSIRNERARAGLSMYAKLCLRASESRNSPREFYGREKEDGLRGEGEEGDGKVM